MTMVGVWIYTIVIFLLPVIMIMTWEKKTGARIKPFWIGVLTFLLFAMVLEQVMHAITEGTNAQADMTPKEECYYAEIDGVPTVLE